MALPDASLSFACGKTMPNRFMLAPMTNQQSHADGTLSADEFNWLVKRAAGGFGLVMTCASHVQAQGQCWPGQLGIFADLHLHGHKQLVRALHEHKSLAVVQLHHGGMRADKNLTGEQPVSPSANEKHGARALAYAEVQDLRDDFIAAAVRAQQAGYDGVELHGAHGYILCQFLSPEINQRKDAYGGPLANRARILFEILEGIRATCETGFLVGARLSMERFGLVPEEMVALAQQLIDSGYIDFLDLSLWDVFQERAGSSMLEYATQLDNKQVRLTVAGKITNGQEVQQVLNAGIDFVTIGRAAILHHDFPQQVIHDPSFRPVQTPVSPAYLKQEGLGEVFIDYMRRWPGFVTAG